MKDLFQRTELLLGKEIMNCIAKKRVIIFGIGGVGSWCAESLVRSGFGHLTIVDNDFVTTSNINRQLHATIKTVGQPKVEVLKQRLLEINPYANIMALQMLYNADTHDLFALASYDFIIDAIDSLGSKIHLIRMATRTDAVFFSSMGAALKIDSSRIKTAEFWKVKGCPFGSIIRKRIRKGDLPAKKFLCVYSDEVLQNKGNLSIEEKLSADGEHIDWDQKKAIINGTSIHITAIFGFTLAGLVVQSIAEMMEK